MSDKEMKNAKPTLTAIPCSLEITKLEVHNAEQLPTLLAHAFGESTIAGIVWATNGTRSINGLTPATTGKEATLEVSSPEGFDIARVYEARIWRVIDANKDDATLAHEFRWVNGVGAVELMLTSDRPKASSEGTESVSVSGWFHKVSYLQHKSAATNKEESAPDTSTGQTKQSKQDTANTDMSALEFIQEEDEYGNTVVVDQLFTGEWAK